MSLSTQQQLFSTVSDHHLPLTSSVSCNRCSGAYLPDSPSVCVPELYFTYHINCLQCVLCHQTLDGIFGLLDSALHFNYTMQPQTGQDVGHYFFCCVPCLSSSQVCVPSSLQETQNPKFQLFSQPTEILMKILSYLPVIERQYLHCLCRDAYQLLHRRSPPSPSFSQEISHIRNHHLHATYSTLVGQVECQEPCQLGIQVYAGGKIKQECYEFGLKSKAEIEVVFRETDRLFFSPVLCYPTASNSFGTTRGPARYFHPVKPGVRPWYPSNGRPSAALRSICWNADAQFKQMDGSLKPAREIQPGDILMSASGNPTTVKQVFTDPRYSLCSAVQLDEFYITPGHPIFYQEDWYRPDEIFPVQKVWIDVFYNFHCQPEHELVVGNASWVCSSLGGWCPRLAEQDPVSDVLFGRGFGTEAARRYSWLLTLPQRIPDHLVEEETDKYWASHNYLSDC